MPRDRAAFDAALEEVFANIRGLGDELLEVEADVVDDDEAAHELYYGRKDSIAKRLAAEYDVLGALLFKGADDVSAEQAPLLAEWAIYRTLPPALPGTIMLGEIEGDIVDQVLHAERVRRAVEARGTALDER
jgi:hypothetical protein